VLCGRPPGIDTHVNDGRSSEDGVSRGQGQGCPSGHPQISPMPYKPAALQVQADWEMKSLEELCPNVQFGNQQEVIDFLLGDCYQN
jgi:hypothetical protein